MRELYILRGVRCGEGERRREVPRTTEAETSAILRATCTPRAVSLAALSSPLIDFPISQATGIVFTISGASDMTLQEVNQAAEAIYEMSDPDANIIFGAQIDESMGSVLSITVVATGFRA